MTEPSQELLKELLHYDPDSGLFTWRKFRGGRVAGDVAGSQCNRGYRRIRLFSKNYLALTDQAEAR